MKSPVLEAIYKRRSIREYTEEEVSVESLHEIISAGIWAPSGLNNQPWRFFIVVDKDLRFQLSHLTKYGHIIKAAPALIVVFLDGSVMYNEVKDHQAAGACIQNMLLAAESLDLGAVWLGQILLNKTKVNALLNLSENFDLMAVIAVGHPLHNKQKSQRNDINTFLLNEI